MDTSWCIHAQGPQPWHRKLLLHHTARMSWDGFQWWVLTPSPAASLGEGKGNSSGWALPGLTQSKGWLWLWSLLLAATVSLQIGSGFGERAGVAAYTLALCFCTSLQGMWERKKKLSWHVVGLDAVQEDRASSQASSCHVLTTRGWPPELLWHGGTSSLASCPLLRWGRESGSCERKPGDVVMLWGRFMCQSLPRVWRWLV